MNTEGVKPMVKLRLNIEPVSAAGCEQRGTLVIQVGVFCLSCCILVVSPLAMGPARAAGSKCCGTLLIQGFLWC